MKEERLIEIKNNLNKRLIIYINAIIEKYGKYIPKERLEYLKNINYEEIIKIHNYGSINGYANSENISMPLCAEKTLEMMSKLPGFGINKKHKSYKTKDVLNNNRSHFDYVLHVFISGTREEKYYEDLLLHETMHYCGSGGASALKEGLNELLTRKIALEKGFETSGCGYSKEVNIALELQNLFGEEVIDQMAFINNNYYIYKFIEEKTGKETAELFFNIANEMQKEFDEKYYKDMETYNGVLGILRKTNNYNKINYSSVYKLIDEYKKTKIM